eukprot:3304952-Rhodomonas_salina.2
MHAKAGRLTTDPALAYRSWPSPLAEIASSARGISSLNYGQAQPGRKVAGLLPANTNIFSCAESPASLPLTRLGQCDPTPTQLPSACAPTRARNPGAEKAISVPDIVEPDIVEPKFGTAGYLQRSLSELFSLHMQLVKV